MWLLVSMLLLLALLRPSQSFSAAQATQSCTASRSACAKLAAATHQQLQNALQQRQQGHKQPAEASGLRPQAPRLLAADPTLAPRPLQIHPEFQVPPGSPYKQPIEVLVNAAISTLQGYLQIRKPAGAGGLLAKPTWFDAETCDSVTQDPDAWSNLTCSSAGWSPDFSPGLASNDVKFPSCDVALLNASHVLSPDCHDREGNITCNRNAAGGEGGEDTDFYLYVTMDGRSCDPLTVAYSTGCGMFDPANNRPTVGMFNFCNASFATDIDDQLSTVLHEVIHSLVFSLPSNAPLFVDNDNQLLGEGNVLRYIEFDSNCSECRSNYTMLVTPTVVREVRRQFDCPTLEGAPLEDQGGDGSAGSHWETELFQGELMTPSAPRDGSYDALTRITLALAEDSGWFLGNWSAASCLRWGRKAGCAFATQRCTAVGAPYYCPVASPLNSSSSAAAAAAANITSSLLEQQLHEQGTEDVCTFDGMSRGNCNETVFSDCRMVRTPESVRVPAMRRASCMQPNAYFNDNALTDYAVGRAFGPGWEMGSDSRCLSTILPLRSSSPPLQLGASSSASKGLCWRAKCSSGGTRLYYKVKGKWLHCPAGRTLDLSRYLPGITQGAITCPVRPDLVCGSLACPSWCSPTGGRCVDGGCWCKLGYYGHDCSSTYLTTGLTSRRRPVLVNTMATDLNSDLSSSQGRGVVRRRLQQDLP